MKIALMNEFSQASKNSTVLEQLKEVVLPLGHEVYNTGMSADGDNPYLTYIHLGIQAAILLNSKAVDFVVTGCGTGQGANISLNNYPGVVCGLVVDPTDAFLFNQINNGNAMSLPYAKGFGWGGELNVKYIFEKAFLSERGMGYPPERKESQNKNVKILNEVKSRINKDIISALKSLDEEYVKVAISGERFQECFFKNCQDKELHEYISSLIDKK